MAANRSLWEQLPKGEQEKVKRDLAEKQKQGPVQQARKGSFQLKGYLRCELSAADKEAFKCWEAGLQGYDWLDRLIKDVDSGYLLKIGESGQGYQASLCAATTGQSWEGYVLTAHAGTGLRAAMLLVFKHEVLMSRDWLAWSEEDSEDFFR